MQPLKKHVWCVSIIDGFFALTFLLGPFQVADKLCRYVVGCILSEGENEADEGLLKRYETSGFQVFSFPEVTHVVTTSFPHRTFLSALLGIRRVYPRLARYIKVLSPSLSSLSVTVMIILCCWYGLKMYHQDNL